MKRLKSLKQGVATIALLAMTTVAAHSADKQESYHFNIKSQALTKAIKEFSDQTHLQIVYAPDQLKGLKTAGTSGEVKVEGALKKLLENTNLVLERVDAETFVIKGRDTKAGFQKISYNTAVDYQDEMAVYEEDERADNASLEEIVITASRREQSLQKVSISVMALDQQNIDQRGIKNIEDLGRITPGLNYQRNRSVGNIANRSQISIRGIQSGVGASTTGIYIDDTPIQTRNAGFTSTSVYPIIFDLERVEVLRGPQGTLFGAGSEGGTIRFITPETSLNELSAYGRAELSTTKGGAESYEIGLAVGGPIVEDKLGYRVSAYVTRTGGYIDRVDRLTEELVESNQNWTEAVVFRGALKWQPTPELSISPSIFFQDLDAGGGDTFWESLSDLETETYRTGNALPAKSSDKFVLYALNVEYDFDTVQFVSNTSYFDRNSLANPDYTQFVRAVTTGQPFPLIPGEYSLGQFIDEQQGFTQEIRLQSSGDNNRLNWVLGAFYNRTKQTDIEIIEGPFFEQLMIETFGVTVLQAFGVPLGEFDSVFTDKQFPIDEQSAIFGQIDYNITEKLKVTVGGRYGQVDFSFRSENEGPFAGNSINVGKQSDKPFTPKVGASYQANDDNLFYASAAKGFRPGGAQRIPPLSCNADLADLGLTDPPATYNSDSAWSYEIGSKNSLLEGRLKLNSSAFYVEWSDIQQSISLAGCGQALIKNLGKAVTKGVDISINALLTESLTLGIMAGFTDTESKETISSGANFISIKGSPISNISKWIVSVTGQYDFEIAGEDGYARVDYAYQGEGPQANTDLFGVDPLVFRRPGAHLLSFRTGIELEAVNISLFVKNVFNNHTNISRLRDSFSSPLFYNATFRPREIGVTVTLNY